MATITTRIGKGASLTYEEADNNFTNLNTDKLEKSSNLSDVASSTSAFNNIAPSQSGNSGKYLTTNGTNTSWGTVTIPTVNDATLTLATSGTGLSGSASFTSNDADNATFTVTSNATNANTPSTIVSRDGSGNFSAGTITASLTGNVTGNVTGNAGTVTNGVYTTGSYADPSWITSLDADKITDVLAIANGGTGVSSRIHVNVKEYGAVGDGVTDDSTAIQNAINSITSGVVFFPAGNYLINTGLTLKPLVSLFAYEGNNCNISAGVNSMTLLSYTNTTGSLVAGFHISGLRFLSNSKTGVTGINIDGGTTSERCSYIQLSELQFVGTFQQAISLKYCANSYITNIFTTNSINGLKIDNCADTGVVNAKIQNGTNYGIHVLGGAGQVDEGTELVNCVTNGQAYGLVLDGVDWGNAANCSFTTAPSGAIVTLNTCLNWKFSNCNIAVAGASPATAGVSLSTNSRQFVFSNCHVVLNTYGMYLQGEDHIVSNCIFTNNSNVDIYLSSCTRASISGNILKSSTVANNIEESSSNYTNVTGNVYNGTITLTGANSVSSNNLNY